MPLIATSEPLLQYYLGSCKPLNFNLETKTTISLSNHTLPTSHLNITQKHNTRSVRFEDSNDTIDTTKINEAISSADNYDNTFRETDELIYDDTNLSPPELDTIRIHLNNLLTNMQRNPITPLTSNHNTQQWKTRAQFQTLHKKMIT